MNKKCLIGAIVGAPIIMILLLCIGGLFMWWPHKSPFSFVVFAIVFLGGITIVIGYDLYTACCGHQAEKRAEEMDSGVLEEIDLGVLEEMAEEPRPG